jgi:hypothetical protein
MSVAPMYLTSDSTVIRLRFCIIKFDAAIDYALGA